MATLHFYEKPGCVTNAKQKQILNAAGHKLVVRNLLQHPWDESELRSFFRELPVAEWFNPSAPAIKNAEINPDELNENQALALMLANPLLIRRPLLDCGGNRCVGFEKPVLSALGIDIDPLADTPETCSKPDHHKACG